MDHPAEEAAPPRAARALGAARRLVEEGLMLAGLGAGALGLALLGEWVLVVALG